MLTAPRPTRYGSWLRASLAAAAVICAGLVLYRQSGGFTSRAEALTQAFNRPSSAGIIDQYKLATRNLIQQAGTDNAPVGPNAFKRTEIVPQSIRDILSTVQWSDQQVGVLIDAMKNGDRGPTDTAPQTRERRLEVLWASTASIVLARKLALGDFSPDQAERAKLALLALRAEPSPLATMTFVDCIANTPLAFDSEWMAHLKLVGQEHKGSLIGNVIQSAIKRVERMIAKADRPKS